MELLRDIEQIRRALNKFSTNNDFADVDIDAFINSNLEEDTIIEYAQKLEKTACLSEDNISEFVNLVMQLRDVMFTLSNFTKLLLCAEQYETIYFLVRKIFINNIGKIKYVSFACDYNFTERYFDRFIEIVKNCNISPSLYIPLVVTAINGTDDCKLVNWRRPAIEYLQNFFNKNENWFQSYLINTSVPAKYNILSAVCEFNTARGINLLIKDMVNKQNYSEERCIEIFKRHNKETSIYIDKFYDTSTFEEKQAFITILIAFLPDSESDTRLKSIYNNTADSEIKDYIANKLNICTNLALKTEKQFLYMARRKIKEPQERALGVVFSKAQLCFNSGLEANDINCSYLIYIIKEEKNLDNLQKFFVLNEIFNSESLAEFSYRIFNALQQKDDILCAKWAIRLGALFIPNDKIEQVCNFTIKLFESGRTKEATYLLRCLTSNSSDIALSIIKDNIFDNELLKTLKSEIIESYATKHNLSVEDVEDSLIGDFVDEKEQARKLFGAFISSREFSPEAFMSNYVNKHAMLPLTQKLVWGEYNFSRLYNTFVVKEDQIVYLTKTSELAQKTIKIVHSLDLDDRFSNAVYAINNPLFEQFKKHSFNVKDFNTMAISVNQFSGMFISVQPFIQYLCSNGFYANKLEGEVQFDCLILKNSLLGLVAQVSFESKISLNDTCATLGDITFYKLDDVLFNQNKAIIQKSSAVSLGGIPARFFDYVLSFVSIASRKK